MCVHLDYWLISWNRILGARLLVTICILVKATVLPSLYVASDMVCNFESYEETDSIIIFTYREIGCFLRKIRLINGVRQ